MNHEGSVCIILHIISWDEEKSAIKTGLEELDRKVDVGRDGTAR